MDITIKVVMALVLTISMVDANQDINNTLQKIKKEMMDLKSHLTLNEEQLTETKQALETKDAIILNLHKELQQTKEGVEDKIEMIQNNLKKKDASIEQLEKEIYLLKDTPWTYVCGAHSSGLAIIQSPITYTNIIHESGNIPESGLDISTGFFTAGHKGIYTVTWGLIAQNDHYDHYIAIYLRKNEVKIEESEHFTQFIAPEGKVNDEGGRTLVLSLDRGDTVDLYCADCTAKIDSVTFCVWLSRPVLE